MGFELFIVGEEGEHSYHLTTTTAQNLFQSHHTSKKSIKFQSKIQLKNQIALGSFEPLGTETGT